MSALRLGSWGPVPSTRQRVQLAIDFSKRFQGDFDYRFVSALPAQRRPRVFNRGRAVRLARQPAVRIVHRRAESSATLASGGRRRPGTVGPDQEKRLRQTDVEQIALGAGGTNMARFNAHSLVHRMRKSACSRARFRTLLAWACVIAGTAWPAFAADEEPLEYQVKAAFLSNFTKFVQWPATAFADEHAPLAICILGEDPFGNTLSEMVKGEAVNGHELAIQRIRRAPDPKSCQVLFVARSEKEVPKILADLGPGILTVGEGEKFLQDGGVIAFVIQDRRVRFDINQTAAAKARLTLSSRLMSVARSVEK